MGVITERSDGAYTSAFASWANRWRALQWQEERQRVAETQKWVNIRKTELKTHIYTDWKRSFYYIKLLYVHQGSTEGQSLESEDGC